MRGLTVVVAGTDLARFRTALGLVATQAALGGRARLFLDGVAVTLATAEEAPAPGLPALAELAGTALDLGADLILCQSGLAACGLDLQALDPRMEAGGLTTIMATLGEDRLLAL